MSINLLAQHVAFIRDYIATVPTPAPPAPAPAPSPRPPAVPPAFAVAAVSPIDLTIATLISPARALAAITTTEPAVSMLASTTIPGCTINLVGSPVSSVTLTGTPTTAGLYRLVIIYVRNDGTNTTLGSSTHEITVLDPATLFVAGSNANYSGRAGVPVNVTLCSPTMARRSDVLAFPDVTVPGAVASLAWTPGATSSGVFSLVGTPTTPGTYTMTVSYYDGARLLGTSVHIITITAAATPAPPAPAPAPAPTPPVPAPIPSPPPAPAPNPIPGSDPLYASVILLHQFDATDAIDETQAHIGSASLTGGGLVATIDYDLTASRVETGARIVSVEEVRPRPYRGSSYLWDERATRLLNVLTSDGSFSFQDGLPQATVYYTVAETIGFAADRGVSLYGVVRLDPGAAGEAAGFAGLNGLQGVAGAEFDASEDDQTIECYARVEDATGLWAVGSGNRYTPLLSLIDSGNALVWTVGLLSTLVGGLRTVRLMLWRATRNNPGSDGPNAPVVCYAALPIGSAPGRFVHAAAQWDNATGKHGCWWNGGGSSTAEVLGSGGTGLPLRAPGAIRVGGSCPAPTIPGLSGSLSILPLDGSVDALRITAASRNTFTGTLTDPISAASRNLPWPNY